MARNTQQSGNLPSIPAVNLSYSSYLGVMVIDDSTSKDDIGPSSAALKQIKAKVGDDWKKGYNESASRAHLDDAKKLGLDFLNSFEGRLKGVYLSESSHEGRKIRNITVLVTDSDSEVPESYFLRMSAESSFLPKMLRKLSCLNRDDLVSIGLYAIKQDKKEGDDRVYYNHVASIQKIGIGDDGNVVREKITVKDDPELTDFYNATNAKVESLRAQGFDGEVLGKAKKIAASEFSWTQAGVLGAKFKQQKESSAPTSRPVPNSGFQAPVNRATSSSVGVAEAPPVGLPASAVNNRREQEADFSNFDEDFASVDDGFLVDSDVPF